MSFRVGDIVGDYRLVGLLGTGAVGRVFKVEHAVTGRVEAMKVLLQNQAHTEDQARRFHREIQVHASLNHPNIASVHNAFWVNGDLVMIMELVEGESLEELMRQNKVSLRDGVDYCCQALEALSYAHSHGVTHRDIKPANMIVTHEGIVKLTDFGLAKTLADPSLTQTGALLGSIAYMAPEQVKGLSEPDARTDTYSCGVVLYELVAGTRPFETSNAFAMMWAHVEQAPEPPQTRNADVPPPLSRIILKALAKSPTERFASAAEFRQALGEIKEEIERGGEAKYFAPVHAPIPLPQEVAVGGDSQARPAAPQAAVGAFAAAEEPVSGPNAKTRPRKRRLVAATAALAAMGALVAFWPAHPIRPAGSVPQPLTGASVESPAAETPPAAGEPAGEFPETAALQADPSATAPLPEQETPESRSNEATQQPQTFPPATSAAASAAQTRSDNPRPRPASVPPPRSRAPLPGWDLVAKAAPENPPAGTPPAEAPPQPAENVQAATPLRRVIAIPTGGSVHSLALSADGRLAAAGIWGNAIQIWDTATGKAVATLRGHNERVAALAFSADASLLVSGGWDGAAKVWKLDEGREIKTMAQEGQIVAVALSDDGYWLAAGSTNKNVYLLNLSRNSASRELKGHKRGVQALAFSPDGKSLASVSSDERVLVWPLEHEGDPQQLLSPPYGATTLAFSPQGHLLAAAGGGVVKIWNVRSGFSVSTIKAPGWLYAVAFDGGSWLSATAPSASPRTIEVRQGSRKLGSLPHGGTVRLIAWSRSGERLATAGEDGEVSVWEVKNRFADSRPTFLAAQELAPGTRR